MSYRKVHDMSADELLMQLSGKPRTQHAIFVALGGDPADMNYARMSFLTQELRQRGVAVQSSRSKGLWL